MVKAVIEKRVALAWLLLAAIVSGTGVIMWKVVVLDAPVSGVMFKSAQDTNEPSATITPFGVIAAALTPQVQQSDSTDGDGDGANHDSTGQITPEAPQPTPTTPMISVYISGAVSKPGVYTLPEGSRVESAVAAAGGVVGDADLDGINLAMKLSDEAHVIVYHKGEGPRVDGEAVGGEGGSVNATTTGTQDAGASPTAQAARTPRPPTPRPASGSVAKPTPSARININTATTVEFEQIPGIGPTLAQRIVAEREGNGPFRSVEELTRVSGIKEGMLAKLRDYVTVGP
jgi:competence protein ComEA